MPSANYQASRSSERPSIGRTLSGVSFGLTVGKNRKLQVSPLFDLLLIGPVFPRWLRSRLSRILGFFGITENLGILAGGSAEKER
ncbi:hypothetical protein CA85_18540 [Allorhodopirellula solitaria]|uniref:Uncharacterized protein n=1 Tax=Allorhodopirellula solitaria TaxID=2527987 RepID=A0A5C5YEC1_9BACT|nr:hypothetical protein CA85_18540 [Allorhodopirellula solitaria]